MKEATKTLISHTIPVLILYAGAVFGLSADEKSTLESALTAIVGAVFAVAPIVAHFFAKKKAKTVVTATTATTTTTTSGTSDTASK